MGILHDLIIVASVGTSRKAPALPEGDGLLGEALHLLSEAAPEEKVLGAIAIASQYERCGRLPVAAPPGPESASQETHPACTRRAGELLEQILSLPNTPTKEQLVTEWLQYAAGAGQRVRHRTLPALLEYGAANRPTRDALAQVAGARGEWLMRHNSRWAFGAAEQDDPRSLWATGTRDQRMALVRRVRSENPSAAREMIASTWGEDSADDRAAFVAALLVGLGPDDEGFLESALDDRSKQVRAAAAELLARLPDSAFVRRMVERAGPLLRLQLTRGKTKSAVVEVTLPPEKFDPAWARDAVAEKPQGGKGMRQGWLAQFVSAIPPTHWSQAWNLPAEACVAAAAGEFAELLLTAWNRAAERHPDPQWIAALLRTAALEGQGPLSLELLNHLPAEQQQALTVEILQSPRTTLAQLAELFRLIRFPLAAKAAGLLLVRLEAPADPQSGAYYLVGSILKEAAIRLPPEMYDELVQRLGGTELDASRKAVDEMLQTLLIRRDLRREFES